MASLLRDLIKQETQERGFLLPLLDKHLSERPEDERRGGFHPSELSKGFCPRELAALRLKIAKKTKKVSPQLRRIFDNGHKFHDRMQTYTREMNIVLNHPELNNPRSGLAQEARLDHEVGLTGNCDDILMIQGSWVVTDYKSSREQVFTNLVTPLKEHRNQVILYMGMIKDMVNVERPMYAVVLYENKNSQEIREFKVEWDAAAREYFAGVVAQLELVNEAIRAQNIYLAPCTCGKCPVQ